jgi:hypothetical protein
LLESFDVHFFAFTVRPEFWSVCSVLQRRWPMVLGEH